MKTLLTILGTIFGMIVTIGMTIYAIRQQDKKVLESSFLKQYVSLNEEFYLTGILAKNLKESDFVPDLIIAVLPGGGMIAEWLSRRYFGDSENQVPVRSISVRSQRKEGKLERDYAEVIDGRLTLLKDPIFEQKKKILIVTDILRSGNTMTEVHEFLINNLEKSTAVYAGSLFAYMYHDEIKLGFKVIFSKIAREEIVFDWKDEK